MDKPSRRTIPMLAKVPMSCAHPGCKEFTFWKRATQRTEGTCLDHFVPARELVGEGVDLAETTVMNAFDGVEFMPDPVPVERGPVGPVPMRRVAWSWVLGGTTRRPTVPMHPDHVGPCALCTRLHANHYGPDGGPLCDQCEQIRGGFAS